MTENLNPEQLRRQTLDLLRFPLAISVMVIHIWPIVSKDSTTIQFSQLPVFTAICNILAGFLRNQSVPIYFFIAGFVFFYNINFNRNTYIQKLKNRVHSLLIPYLIWNTLSLLIEIITRVIAKKSLNLSLTNIIQCFTMYNGALIGNSLDDSGCPINYPLWFLRDLMIVVLCTPILFRLIKYSKHYFILLLGCMWLASTYMLTIPAERIFSAFFFFSWGAYMSICKLDMLNEFGRYFKSSMIVYPILGALHVAATYICPQACLTIKNINIVVGLLFAYNLSSWLLRHGFCNVSSFLAASGFFIYVAHSLIINRITSLQTHFVDTDSDVQMILVRVITMFVTTCILLGAFHILRRYMPSVLKVIAGRK